MKLHHLTTLLLLNIVNGQISDFPTFLTFRTTETFLTTSSPQGIDELVDNGCRQSNCEQKPVCGSDCVVYPSSCYMEYVSCNLKNNLTHTDFSYCSKTFSVKLKKLPAVYKVPFGESIVLVCDTESGVLPMKVKWYEIMSGKRLERSSSSKLTINNVTDTDRFFFCQVTNCNDEIVQSNTVKVTLARSVCSVYGTGHIRTYDSTTYSHSSECTYVASMDCLYGKWFVYTRFISTWQIQQPSLTTVTFYYNYVPIELQRGWMINYFGSKIIIKEGETKNIFGIILTFDGIYLNLETPEVRLSWDGLGSLLVSVAPDSYTCGLCGNNDQNKNNDLQARFTGATSEITRFVKSWALDRAGRCKHGHDQIVKPRDTTSKNITKEECEVMSSEVVSEKGMVFYKEACKKDISQTGLITGNVPISCWSYLALYHKNDYSIGNTTVSGGDGRCELSVKARQFLAYYAGCPNDSPPFNT